MNQEVPTHTGGFVDDGEGETWLQCDTLNWRLLGGHCNRQHGGCCVSASDLFIVFVLMSLFPCFDLVLVTVCCQTSGKQSETGSVMFPVNTHQCRLNTCLWNLELLMFKPVHPQIISDLSCSLLVGDEGFV